MRATFITAAPPRGRRQTVGILYAALRRTTPDHIQLCIERKSPHALNHIVKLIIINYVIEMNDSLHMEKTKIKERQIFVQINLRNRGIIDNDTHHFFTGLGIAIGFSAIFYAVIGVLVWYW